MVLTVIERSTLHDGEPVMAWDWDDSEGGLETSSPADPGPAGADKTHIHDSKHDPRDRAEMQVEND